MQCKGAIYENEFLKGKIEAQYHENLLGSETYHLLDSFSRKAIEVKVIEFFSHHFDYFSTS